MEKLVKDFTYKDLSDYGNYRACDGNWSFQLATAFILFYQSVPKSIFRRKKNKYVRKHIDELFNLTDYPNMMIDIDTGLVTCDREVLNKEDFE